MLKRSLFLALLTTFTLSAAPLKQRMLAELDFVKGVFEVKYAPLKWKEEYANFSLEQEVNKAIEEVEKIERPTLQQYHKILKRFFNATKDYHVGVNFFASEEASLPFLVKGAEGRFFFAYIDRTLLPFSKFPFHVGDEILTFDGLPVGDVVEQIREEELGSNTFETDQALAEMMLTNRSAANGDTVPSGDVQIVGISRGQNRRKSVKLSWYYIPEKVGAGHFRPVDPSDLNFTKWRLNPAETIKQERFFERLMIYSGWNASYVGCSIQENPHAIGARSSFIPPLGKKVWSAKKEGVFDAYTFLTPNGKCIGYIRIPHYMGDTDEVKEFCEVIKLFENRTEALVIDQINNPGGSIFYLYALLAALTDSGSMATPKHRIMLSQEEVYMAITILEAIEGVDDLKKAQEAIGETMGGYPVTMEMVALLRTFCNFILNEWAAGKIFTDPTHLFGVDAVTPHPRAHYTKPILLLTNSLDFSAGDFFPAVLQDNRRATILGTRTAGAGGYVLGTSYPNQTAVAGFSLTGSIAERLNKKPIENLGIKPDIQYTLTPYDLQNNYAGYVEKIVHAVEELVD